MELHPWPAEFLQKKAGRGCPQCEMGRVDETEHGVRFFVGHLSDGYLQKQGPTAGYCVVIFRGRHAGAPQELSPDEHAAFWSEVGLVARAIEDVYRPIHLNFQILGTRTRTSTSTSSPDTILIPRHRSRCQPRRGRSRSGSTQTRSPHRSNCSVQQSSRPREQRSIAWWRRPTAAASTTRRPSRSAHAEGRGVSVKLGYEGSRVALGAAFSEPLLDLAPGERACLAGIEHHGASLRLDSPHIIDLVLVDGLAVQARQEVRGDPRSVLDGECEHLSAQVVGGLCHAGIVSEAVERVLGARVQAVVRARPPDIVDGRGAIDIVDHDHA